MVINVKYLAGKQQTINFCDRFTVFHIHLPGVVGGTSLTSMLRLFILFCTASSLGCFSTIVFIGAGVIIIIIIIIITLFQEGDIYITIVNHDGPQNNRNILCKKNYIKNLISLVLKLH